MFVPIYGNHELSFFMLRITRIYHVNAYTCSGSSLRQDENQSVIMIITRFGFSWLIAWISEDRMGTILTNFVLNQSGKSTVETSPFGYFKNHIVNA